VTAIGQSIIPLVVENAKSRRDLASRLKIGKKCLTQGASTSDYITDVLLWRRA
jgi:hypothetical protein